MLTNMDVFCDLFLNRQTEKWNRIVLSKRRKELFNHLDQYIWNVNFSDFVNKGDLHWPLNDRWGWTLIVFLFVCLFFYFYFYFYFLILVTVSLPYREKLGKNVSEDIFRFGRKVALKWTGFRKIGDPHHCNIKGNAWSLAMQTTRLCVFKRLGVRNYV